MSDSPKIYAALQAVMSAVGHIPKDREAGSGSYKFKFRGIDQVLTTLAPVLREHKVMGPVPRVVSHHVEGNRALLVSEYAWVSLEDGSEVRGSTVGEATDSQDKASNKAMSIALKYFIIQSLCIPIEEGTLDEQEVLAPAPRRAAPPPVPQDAEADLAACTSLEQLKQVFDAWAPQAKADGWAVDFVRIKDKVKAKLLPK